MPSNHLVLCFPLLLLPSIFPSIMVFSSGLAVHIRWPKFQSYNFSISSFNECSGLISFRIDWFNLLLSKGLSRAFSSTTVWKHKFFDAQPPLWSNSHIRTWPLVKPQLRLCRTLSILIKPSFLYCPTQFMLPNSRFPILSEQILGNSYPGSYGQLVKVTRPEEYENVFLTFLNAEPGHNLMLVIIC